MAKELIHKDLPSNIKNNTKNNRKTSLKNEKCIISKAKTSKTNIFSVRIKKAIKAHNKQKFALIIIGLFLISSFFTVFSTSDLNNRVSGPESFTETHTQKNGFSNGDSWKYTHEGNSSANDGIYDIIQESNTGTEYRFNPYPDYNISGIPSNGYNELQVDFQTSNLDAEDINLEIWNYSAKQWKTRIPLNDSTPTPVKYNLTIHEINTGECYIRFVDSDQSFGDDAQTVLEIDYVRVYTPTNTGDDYVDNDTSNVDGETDKGNIIDFNNFTEFDSNNGVLVEENTGSGSGEVAVDNITTNSGDLQSFTHSHTVSGINRLLIVSVQIIDKEVFVTDVTYAGESNYLTKVTEKSYDDNIDKKPRVEVWKLINPPTGEHDVIITLSEKGKAAIGVISYTGVDQTTPIDGVNSTFGKSTTPSITVASNPGDLVQDAMASDSHGLPINGSGQTLRWTEEMTGDKYGAGSTEAGATSVVMNWTLNENKEWVIIGFNIKKITYSANYEIDQEIQWTSLDTNMDNYWFAIFCGTFNTTESIEIYIWDTDHWVLLFVDLNENNWNNITITSYIDSTTTIRFLGGHEIGDTERSEWNIDVCIIYGRTDKYDYTTEGNANANDEIFDSYTESGSGAQYTFNPADQTYTANDTANIQNYILYIEYQLTDSVENWHVLLYNFTSSVFVNIGSITSKILTNFTYEITDIDFFNSTMGFQVRFDDNIEDMTQTILYIDFIALYITPISTTLTVDETTLTKEIGETAMFRVTFKDSKDFGITGANISYLWDYGSGQLLEEGDGVYTLSLKTSPLTKGTYHINITASLTNYAVKGLQVSLIIVPKTTGFLNQIRDLFPYIALLILGAFGSIITLQKYSNHKQELFDKKKIRRIMVVYEVFALYDQTPSEVFTENGIIDKDLISGFFTAIKDITSEVTGITYETMKVYRAHPYYFVYTGTFYCVIILNESPSPSLEKKLLLFSRIVHEKYSNVIEECNEEYFSPTLGIPNTQLDLDEEVMKIFGLTPITALQDIVTVSLSYNEIEKLKIKDNIKVVLMAGHFLKDQFGTFPLEDLIRAISRSLNNIREAHNAVLEALKLGLINVVEKPLIPKEKPKMLEIKTISQEIEKFEDNKKEENGLKKRENKEKE